MRRLIASAFGVVALSNCLDPTEIVLELSTNVACPGPDRGVAIAVGAPNDDTTGVSAFGNGCSSDGGLGSVVILPRGGIDEPIGIRVMLGIDASADQCHGPKFDGCIVARRSLRFDPHTPLTLPVELDQSCVGVPCTPDSTCVSGACVDAGVVCDGGSCVIETDASTPPLTCVPTLGAVPIQNGIRSGSVTRIARTSTGWVLLWESTGSGTIQATTVLLSSGGTPNVATPFTLAATSSAVGALGSDSSGYQFTYESGPSTNFVVVTGNGSAGVSMPTTRAGVNGIFAIDGAGTFATGVIIGTANQPAITTFVPPYANAVPYQPFNVNSGALNMGLTQNTTSASDFYATFNDAASCYAYSCNGLSGVIKCATPDVVNTCDGIRAAARGSSHAILTRKSNLDLLTVDGKYAVGSADSFGAFTIVAAKSDFVITGVAQGAVFGTRYDGVTQPAITPITTNVTAVTSLDAVADGPTSNGYAMAMVAGTSVYFMHVCN